MTTPRSLPAFAGIALVLVLLAGLSGCSALMQILGLDGQPQDGSPDLSLTNVELLKTNNVIAGITFTVENSGTGDLPATDYRIVLADSSTIDVTADYPIIYQGSLAVAAGSSTTLSITSADIAAHLQSTTMPSNGKYHLGLIVDPTSSTGAGPRGVASSAQTWFINGYLAAYGVKGTLSAESYVGPVYNYCQSCYTSGYLADGSYTVYYGVVPAGSSLLTSPPNSTSFKPEEFFLPGFGSTTISYATGTGSTGTGLSYTLGIPGAGDYAVVAVIDYPGDGKILFDSSASIYDPIAMYNDDPNADGITTTSFSADNPSADMVFYAAPN